MKNYKFIIISLIIYLFISSCRDSNNDYNEKELNVSDITFKLQAKRENIKDRDENIFYLSDSKINYLHYYVYEKPGGQRVKTKILERRVDNQPDFEFGYLTDTLNYGEYYICILATEKDVMGNLLEMHMENYFTAYFVIREIMCDMFFETVEINVDSEYYTGSVLLERMVGMVEIEISDIQDIPDNLLDISAAMEPYVPKQFNLNEKRGMGISTGSMGNYKLYEPVSDMFTKEDIMAMEGGNSFSFYILPASGTERTGNLHLFFKMINEQNEITGEQVLIKKDFSIESNQVIRYEGNLIPSSIKTTGWKEKIY